MNEKHPLSHARQIARIAGCSEGEARREIFSKFSNFRRGDLHKSHRTRATLAPNDPARAYTKPKFKKP